MKHEIENLSNFKIRKTRKIDKIDDSNFEIPKFCEYNTFINNKYRGNFLKEICKFYGLKVSGNKSELTNRIYFHLYNSNYSIIIQKHARRYLRQKYNKLLGPALYKRSLCMNSNDFLTFENMDEISYGEFFSYMSPIDNSIWGFNIISFYNLFSKSDRDVLNPYTREKISYLHFDTLKQIVKYNKMFKKPVNIILNNNSEIISLKKRIELQSFEIFQYIDELGNYTDVQWFTSLNRLVLLKFIRYLVDIWEYRAQLSSMTKKEICHPYGNPFRYIDLSHIYSLSYTSLQKTCLSIIEQFVKKALLETIVI